MFSGANVMCVQIWGEDNGPWMQALHFSFGLGAFVAPLLAEPFLSKKNPINTTLLMVNDTGDVMDFTTLPSVEPLHERSLEQPLPGLKHFEDFRETSLQKRDTDTGKSRHSVDGFGFKSRILERRQQNMALNNLDTEWDSQNVGKSKRAVFQFKGSEFDLKEKIKKKIDQLFLAWIKEHEKNQKKSKATTVAKTDSVKPVTKAQVFSGNKQSSNKTKNKQGDSNSGQTGTTGQRPRPGSRANVPPDFGVDTEVDNERKLGSKSSGQSSGGKASKRPRPPSDRGLIPPNFGTDKEKEPKKGVGHSADPQKPDDENKESGGSRPRPSGPGRNVPPEFGLDTESNSGEEDTDSETTGETTDDIAGAPRRPKPQRPGRLPPRFGTNFRGRKNKRNSEGTSNNQETVTESAFMIVRTFDQLSTASSDGDQHEDEEEPDANDSRVENSKKRSRKEETGLDNSKKESDNSQHREKREINDTFSEQNRFVQMNDSSNAENTVNSRKPAETNVSSTTVTVDPKLIKPKVLSASNNDVKVANGQILKGPHKQVVDHPQSEEPTPLTQSANPKNINLVNITSKPLVNQTNHSVSEMETNTVKEPPTVKNTETPAATTLSTLSTTSKTTPVLKKDPVVASTTVTDTPESTMLTMDTINSTDHHNVPQNDTGVLKKIKEDFNYAVVTFEETISGLTAVQFAYLIIACYVFIISMLFLVMCCRTKCTLSAIKLSSSVTTQSVTSNQSTCFKIQLLILLFVFFFLYVGMEITVGGLLLTFSVEYLNWSKSKGTLLTSVFWGSFATARGLAIIFAKCFSPPIMLILNLVLTNLSLLALVISIDSNPTMMWYCTVVLGVGMASIFPTGVSWAERYIDLTSRATAVFVVGSSLGEMCVPAFTGYMFEQKGPKWLIYIVFGLAILSIVIYIIMQNLASNSGDKYSKFTKLQDTTLTELDDADLEMESIPLTPDLENSDSHTMGGYYEQNGSVSKSRKKVTFNLKDDSHQEKGEVMNRVRGSILKGKGVVKTS